MYSLGVRNQGRGATVKQNGRHACAVRAPSLESRQSFEGDRGPLQGEVNSGEECHGSSSLSELISVRNDVLQAYEEFEEFERLAVRNQNLFFQDYDRMLGKIWHAIRKAQALLEKFETSPPPVFTTGMAVTHSRDEKLPEVSLDVHSSGIRGIHS